jgi:hypothetical protein
MKSLTVVAAIAISSVLGACQPKEDIDPITQLERKLDATNGAWQNGFIFPIYLPEDASAEDILVQVFRKPVRDQGIYVFLAPLANLSHLPFWFHQTSATRLQSPFSIRMADIGMLGCLKDGGHRSNFHHVTPVQI